jgi:hypothetical protein
MDKEGKSESLYMPENKAYREAIYEGTDTVRGTATAGGSSQPKVQDPNYWEMTSQLGNLDTIKSRKEKMQRGELVDATGNREPPSKAAKGDGKRFPTQHSQASGSSGNQQQLGDATGNREQWQSGWDQQTWKERAKDLGRKCDKEDRRQEDQKWKDWKRK